MYSSLLYLHSWMSWAVLILMAIVLVKSLMGWLQKQPFTAGDNKLHLIFVSMVHIQLIVGLLLYFVYSAYTKAGVFADMGAAMKDSTLRFFGVEHIFGMILAVILITVGRAVSKRKSTDVAKHKTAFIFYTIALILIFGVLPWIRLETIPVFRF